MICNSAPQIWARKSVWMTVAWVQHKVPAHASLNALQSGGDDGDGVSVAVKCYWQDQFFSAAQSAPSFTSVSLRSLLQKETDRACLPTWTHTSTRQQQFLLCNPITSPISVYNIHQPNHDVQFESWVNYNHIYQSYFLTQPLTASYQCPYLILSLCLFISLL